MPAATKPTDNVFIQITTPFHTVLWLYAPGLKLVSCHSLILRKRELYLIETTLCFQLIATIPSIPLATDLQQQG